MGRRIRHMNPSYLPNAAQCVDARFIQGATNNAYLSAWADRRGVNSYSQGDVNRHPQYKTNRVNGQPAVEFLNPRHFTSSAVINLGASYTVLAAAVRATTSDLFFLISSHSGANVQTLRFDSNGSLLTYGGALNANTYVFSTTDHSATTTWGVTSVSATGPLASDFVFRQNGVSRTTVRYSTFGTATPSFRAGSLGAHYMNTGFQNISNNAGSIAHVTIFTSGSLPESVRKRAEHHIAYSFKLACS